MGRGLPNRYRTNKAMLSVNDAIYWKSLFRIPQYDVRAMRRCVCTVPFFVLTTIHSSLMLCLSDFIIFYQSLAGVVNYYRIYVFADNSSGWLFSLIRVIRRH